MGYLKEKLFTTMEMSYLEEELVTWKNNWLPDGRINYLNEEIVTRRKN